MQPETTLQTAAAILEHGNPVVAIDFETTGPNKPYELWSSPTKPETDNRPHHRIPRLVQLTDGDKETVVDLWHVKGGVKGLEPAFKRAKERGVQLVAQNATFELETLLGQGIDENSLPLMHDTRLGGIILDQRIVGTDKFKPRFDLGSLCKRHLDLDVAKDEQKSDWGAVGLTDSQLQYAATDAPVTLALWNNMVKRLHQWGDGYQLLQRLLVPTAKMNLAGMAFDPAAHQTLIELNTQRYQAQLAKLNALNKGVRNHNSADQVSEWVIGQLALWGSQSNDPDLAAQIYEWRKTPGGNLNLRKQYVISKLPGLTAAFPGIGNYLLERLRFKEAGTLLNSFGPKLGYRLDADGRMRGSLNLAAAATGRYSCSDPNLQNMPREEAFRRLFVAPPGRRLVIADYSQIELRVAALLAGDEQMLQIFRDGVDIHSGTASKMFSCPVDQVDKNQRRGAKAINFGILFGAGAPTIALNSGFSIPEAQGFIETWLGAFPDIDHWRETDANAPVNDGVLITAGKRPIWYHPSARQAQLFNYPIQGGAFDCIAWAIHHLQTRMPLQCPSNAMLVGTVHDELLIECDDREDDIEACKRCLVDCMRDGLISVFPDIREEDAQVVDADAVYTWAEKP